MKWAVGFVIGLLCMVSAAAIGIAPANSMLVYTPGKAQTLQFRVYNTEQKALTATITTNGTLSEYLTMDAASISFLPTERSKAFTATLKETDTIPADLDGYIIIEANTEVAAHIVVKKPASMPTGNVVEDTEQKGSNDHLFTILLVALAIGNVLFFTIAGVRKRVRKTPNLKRVKTPEELLAFLRQIDDAAFNTFVNDDKNEFADWLEEHHHPDLAYATYDLMDRQQMISALERDLHLEPPTDEAGLRSEIVELKHELDTFDFRGFEKVYK
jgi:hypothetical protein